jgi:hypothetical protein
MKERVAELFVLGYDAASQGNWVAAFRSNIVSSSSMVEMSIMQEKGIFTE